MPFKSYLFTDAGMINTTHVTHKNYRDAFSKVRSDAGFGLALTLNNWGALQMVKPLTLRLDFPLFLNKIPYVDSHNTQKNRFVFGIGRVF